MLSRAKVLSAILVLFLFTNLASVFAHKLGLFLTHSESLGPSTRKTGLIISEVMYHPKSNGDGKVLEYIEIFNTEVYPVNLGLYTLRGSINYTFPSNKVLAARNYMV